MREDSPSFFIATDYFLPQRRRAAEIFCWMLQFFSHNRRDAKIFIHYFLCASVSLRLSIYFHHMKYLFISMLIIFSSCKTTKTLSQNELPAFIKEKIATFQQSPVANPPRSIYSYSYNGKTVYFITAPCCDIPSQLFDDSGNLICHPDGGFSGKGDEKCTDFFSTRTDEKLIWKDSRNFGK